MLKRHLAYPFGSEYLLPSIVIMPPLLLPTIVYIQRRVRHFTGAPLNSGKYLFFTNSRIAHVVILPTVMCIHYVTCFSPAHFQNSSMVQYSYPTITA